MFSAPGVFFLMAAMTEPNSCGRFHPVVSGMLMVVAPAWQGCRTDGKGIIVQKVTELMTSIPHADRACHTRNEAARNSGCWPQEDVISP